MSKEIKNEVYFYGRYENVLELIKNLKGDTEVLDFSVIEPMEEDKDDIIFDDFSNYCLNVFLKSNNENSEKLIKMFKFVGITRKVPYEFTVLSDEELLKESKKYPKNEVKSELTKIITKIKDKTIFNGYMVRDAIWGTGTGPAKSKFKDNKVTFVTYDKAPVLAFIKLSSKYPEVRIDHVYEIDGKKTVVKIVNGKAEYVEDENTDYNEPVLFSLIKENVCI